MAEKVSCIIVSAGSGTRMGGVMNKVFLPLGESTVIDHTINAFCGIDEIEDIVIVTRQCDILECMDHINNTEKNFRIVKGGATRQESVFMGLSYVKNSDIVVIHDGARALVLPRLIEDVIKDAKNFGAATLGVPSKDTLKVIDDDGFIKETLDREKVYNIQTPQVFKTADIIKAHEKAIKDGFSATDDCSLYEKYIGKVKITKGSYDNIKLTTPEDMEIAENILKKR